MEALYKVVYTGELGQGVEKTEVTANLVRHFGLSEQKAGLLLDAGKPVTLKQGLTRGKADQYRNALEKMGLAIRLEAMPRQDSGSTLSLAPLGGGETTPEEAAKPDQPICPKCGSSRIEGDSCLDCGIVISKYLARQALQPEQTGTTGFDAPPPPGKGGANPYSTPQAELVEAGSDGEMSGPATAPARHGWAWVTGGFRHFRQNPFAWIVAMVVWMVLSVIITLIPFIGSIAISILSPVITAGFMIGADAQDQGRDFEVGHLFAGFSRNPGQLLLVGLFYFAGLIVIGLLMGVLIAGAIASLGDLAVAGEPDPAALAALMGSPTILVAMLLGVALSIPLFMAYWFAPTLVALEGLSALTAMKLSFSGCMKNMLSFLLYGLIVLLLLFLAVLPFGLGLLIALPTLLASIYVSYKDIYYQGTED
jgi:uncharacterized membrane protein/ribosomal protein L32